MMNLSKYKYLLSHTGRGELQFPLQVEKKKHNRVVYMKCFTILPWQTDSFVCTYKCISISAPEGYP